MEQLDLFIIDSDYEEITIPNYMVSPLESKKGVKTKEFREEQKAFTECVHAIQNYYDCSWFEAREMFFEYRDLQKPVKVKYKIRSAK